MRGIFIKVYKSYKFRMYPNEICEKKLDLFFSAANFIYNYYFNMKEKNSNLSFFDMQKDLFHLKQCNPWLKEIDGSILINEIHNLRDAFLRYEKKQNLKPKSRRNSRYKSYRTVYLENVFKGKKHTNMRVDLKKGIIKLPKLDEIKIKGYTNLKEFDFKILSATVKKEAGKYYVAVSVVEEIKVEKFTPNKIIGIDLGIKDLVTTSDGVKYSKIPGINTLEKRLNGLNKGLSKSQKGSKNREKIIAKIERLNQKIHNKRKFHLHSITNELISNNDVIIAEDLKVKEMIKEGTSKLSKYLVNSSLSEIIRQLEYKAKWNNKRLYKINTYYPSSQICSNCKARNMDLKDLNIRFWECPKCHVWHDRDINASLNILEEGVRVYFRNFKK